MNENELQSPRWETSLDGKEEKPSSQEKKAEAETHGGRRIDMLLTL